MMKVRAGSRTQTAVLAALVLLFTQSLLSGSVRAAAALLTGAEVLAQSRAKYAALRSYADNGRVMTEYRGDAGPTLVEKHSFRTAYSTPRKLLFDFKKGPEAGGDRLVLWGDGENFHTWWSATHVHDLYPRGQGANAFALSSLPTLGSALMIPPLLFPQAGLHGPLSDFALVRSEGVTTIDGKSCYKLVGTVALAFSTGNVRGARATTVWIDTETLLVRRLLEDTPDGMGTGILDRVTTDFEPQSDPAVDPAVFQFTVPAG